MPYPLSPDVSLSTNPLVTRNKRHSLTTTPKSRCGKCQLLVLGGRRAIEEKPSLGILLPSFEIAFQDVSKDLRHWQRLFTGLALYGLGLSTIVITINYAKLTGEDEIKGSIEPGKLADFAILSEDILTVPPKQMLQMKALATYVGGKQVYHDPSYR